MTLNLNVEEGDLDRLFSNELTVNDWEDAATYLQERLTDSVIDASIRLLPPSVFAVSGPEITKKLKSRRNQLRSLAITYYHFLARQVEIVGSKKREYFDLATGDNGEIAVNIYRINNRSIKEDNPYYKRVFKPAETKEIRIYGIDGRDVYAIKGPSSPIKIRLIGGIAKDSIVQSGDTRLNIYDDHANSFQATGAHYHLSNNKEIHDYKYEHYQYDLRGFDPLSFIGVTYWFKNYKWRRPLPIKHSIGVSYSIPQHAFGAAYTELYPHFVGKWDLLLKADWDAVRFTNFFGHGNESVLANEDPEYYRMRTSEWSVVAGLHRGVGKNSFDITAYYHRIKIINDTDRYAARKFIATDPNVFLANGYGGLKFAYSYTSVNDSIVPTRGFNAGISATLANNFARKDFFQNYTAGLHAWIPLSNKFSLAIKAGGTTIAGRNLSLADNAQPYEHAMIGGSESLRGYRTQRFWGKTSYYNCNELRFITNIRSYLLNGKMGFLVFFDDGRVWLPNEVSDVIHTSYGAGIHLVPFHLVNASVTYGVSREGRLVQFNIAAFF